MSEANLALTPRKYGVQIEYCMPCDYSQHALQAAVELMTNYQHVIDRLVFKMGSKGVFEVTVDGETIFSKKVSKRHPHSDEVLGLFRDFVGHEVPTYR